MKVRGCLLALLSAVTYGLIPLFAIPLRASNLSFDLVLFYRFFISALLILAYLLYQKEKLRVSLKELGILAALGLLFSLGAEFLFWSYELLSPGIASTIFFVYPILVVLIMAFFFKEKIKKATVLSLFITICGVFIISTKDSIFSINFLGLMVSLVGSTAYAVYIVTVNKAKLKLSGIAITFYSLLFSSVYYLGKVVLLGQHFEIPDTGTLLNISLFGFVTSVVSITALVYAVKMIGSTLTSIMGAVEPVVAVGVSVMLFGERLSIILMAGIALILTGVLIDVVASSRKEKLEIQKE